MPMAKKVLFRADADKKSGTGDLISLIYLSGYFTGWDKYFVIKDTKEARDILNKHKISNVIAIPRNIKAEGEIALLNEFLSAECIDVFVLEITAYSQRRYKDIRAKYKVCIDFYGAAPDNFDLIINWDVGTQGLYSRRHYPKAKFLLGPRYAILKKDIIGRVNRIKNGASSMRRTVKNILIFFGGFDEFNFTLRTTRLLEMIDAGLKLNIILGAGYPYKQALISYLRRSTFKGYRVRQNILNIYDEYSRADLAVIAGGLSLLEVIALRIPALVVATYKHQIKRCKFFQKRNVIIYSGFRRLDINDLSRAIDKGKFSYFNEKFTISEIPGLINERINHKI